MQVVRRRSEFTSAATPPARGNWVGLRFWSNAKPNSLLRNAVVEYAGRDSGGATAIWLNTAASTSIPFERVTIRESSASGLTAYGGTLSIRGCTFSSNTGRSIDLANSGNVTGQVRDCPSIESVAYRGDDPNVTWTSNTFVNYGVQESVIEPDAFGNFGCDNTFSGPVGYRTQVFGGTVGHDQTWCTRAGIINVTGWIEVQGPNASTQSTLTIVPGAELRFNTGNTAIRVGVTNPGALIADGDGAGGPAPIRFTSAATPTARGNWVGLRFWSNAKPNSVLRNAVVEYAGRDSGGATAIWLNTAASTSIPFERVTIRESSASGLTAYGGTLSIRGCTFSSNTGRSIDLANSGNVTGQVRDCPSIESVAYSGDDPNVTWTSNTFVNYGVQESLIEPDAFGNFGCDNTFSGPVGYRTQVFGGTVGHDQTWCTRAGIINVTGWIEVQGPNASTQSTLTIVPGAELRFNTGNTAIRVGVTNPGALIADGDGAGGPAPIRFTSAATPAARGNWVGLRFWSNAKPNSLLRNAVVEYAGRDSGGATAIWLNTAASTSIPFERVTIRESSASGLTAYGGTLSIRGCTFSSNTGHSIDLANSGNVTGQVRDCPSIESVAYSGDDPNVTWTSNTFVNYGVQESLIEPDAFGNFGCDNTFSGPVGYRTQVFGGTVGHDQTWCTRAGIINVTGWIEVQGLSAGGGTTLTIVPGADLRFNTGSTAIRVGLTNPGALIADGDGAGGPSPIKFTSAATPPARGNWVGLRFWSNAKPNSVLRNVVVEYAGRDSGGATAIWLNTAASTSIPFERVTIRESSASGLTAYGGTLSIRGCTFSSNTGRSIDLANSGNVTGQVRDCPSIESVAYLGDDPNVTWTNNTFVNYGVQESVIEPDAFGNFGCDNTFSGPVGYRTQVFGGTVGHDQTWCKRAGIINVTGWIDVQGPNATTQATLTISPGADLRFNTGSTAIRVGLTNPGALIADGNAAGGPAAIRFTSAATPPARGNWVGLRFWSNAKPTSLLRNAVVQYAGRDSSGSTGIWVRSSSPRIEACDIGSNAGHGIYTDGGSAQPTIVRSSVHDGSGRGIYVAAGLANQLVVDANGIRAMSEGGIYAASSALVTNNIVSGCGGSVAGAGIQLAGGQVLVVHNTVHGNHTSAAGGGIHSSGSGTRAVIHNNSIDGNSAASGGGIHVASGAFEILGNDVYQNTGGDYGGIPSQTGTNGNTSSDPRYVDAAQGDFHLRPDSPSIDAAFASWVSVPWDFEGDPRPHGAAADQGADEFNFAVEQCNGIDDDRDGTADEGCDDDADGYCDVSLTVADPFPAVCPQGGGDCDDENATVFPGATQLCDGVNNDCRHAAWPVVPADETDDDRDGYVECSPWIGPAGIRGGDCDDAQPTVNPGVLDERPGSQASCCDARDNDCDGMADEADSDCQVATPCEFDVPMGSGWSFVGPACQMGYRAEDMCVDVNADGVPMTEADRWLQGGWSGHVCGRPFSNWTVEAGQGYQVKSGASGTWRQQGACIPPPLAVSFVVGWNSLSRPPWAGGTMAERLCAEIRVQGGCPVEIERWSAGGWSGHICGLPFNDFRVEPGNGLLVKVSCASAYAMDRPAAPPGFTPSEAARAEEPPPQNGAHRGETAIAARGSAEPDDARTGRIVEGPFFVNQTATAFAVVWKTEEIVETLAMLIAPDATSRRVADVRGDSWKSRIHFVTVSGLEPDSEYRIEIGGAGAGPWSVRTGRLLPIPEPRVEWSRLDRSGGVVLVRVPAAERSAGAEGAEAAPSGYLASLVENGYWSVNLGNLRSEDLRSYVLAPADARLELLVIEENETSRRNTVRRPTARTEPAEQ